MFHQMCIINKTERFNFRRGSVIYQWVHSKTEWPINCNDMTYRKRQKLRKGKASQFLWIFDESRKFSLQML